MLARSEPTQATNLVREHVEMIHRLAEGVDGLLVVSAFNASLPNDRGVITHHRPGDVDGMIAAVEAHTATPSMNVYCGLQVMRRGLARGARGTEADIVAVLGLVADMDADTGRDAGGYPAPPNYVIETSPGNFQPFWLFDRPVAPGTAKEIARKLKVFTGSDHGTADIAHVWRVPGTLNWPNRKKLERGRPQEPAPVRISERWTGSLTDPTALALSMADVRASSSTAVPVDLGDLPDVDGVEVSPGAASLLAADHVGDRSAHAARVVERLAFDSHPADVAAALFLSASGDWFGRYTTRERASADFTRLWARYGEPHAERRKGAAEFAAKLSSKSSKAPKADNDNAASPLINAQELLGMRFPPVKYILPGYVAEGLTLLGGRPKLGKSWLTLGACVAVATGGQFLGEEVEEGDAFYLALEDNARRLQDRLRTVLPPLGTAPDMSRLTLLTEAPRIDTGLVDLLDTWRKNADNPRLVAIDTLAKVRPPKGRQDSYEADYAALAPLQKWAGEHRLGLIVVTHVRKMHAEDPLEMISGTNGLTGAADSILVLNRDQDGPKLHGRGRDIEDVEKAIRFERGLWTALGDVDDVRRSSQRKAILEAMREANLPMGPAEIAKASGVKVGSVRHLITKMVTAGDIEKLAFGTYRIPPEE